MNYHLFNLILGIMILLSACSEEAPSGMTITPPDPELEDYYFPPINSNQWETISPEELEWNIEELNLLNGELELLGTRAFIILKDGKIVVEKYWGTTLLGNGEFTPSSQWYWASAGKTLTAFLTGVAQEQGMLNIEDKTSDYLGTGWTSLSKEKEDLITIRNQLTMTTGLEYRIPNIDCTEAECLEYRSDAGEQWYYHNGPYTLLESVVSSAAGIDYNSFTDQYIEEKIGMEGRWQQLEDNNVYFSTGRDAARFGSLLFNKGKWDGESILGDQTYLENMTNSSQELNPSYGYLTWLNGKSSIVLPGLAISFNIPLAADAPDDLYAGLGKNGQIIDVVPSMGLVLIRMGESPDDRLVPTEFHNDIWKRMMNIVN